MNDFLHFRERTTNQSKKETVELREEGASDISAFAGMLSDLAPEEMQCFDDAVNRRPLVADREI